MKTDATQLYLGDGVYARFNGYQIILAANDHRNEVIHLELDVMKRLIEFAHKHMPETKETANG